VTRVRSSIAHALPIARSQLVRSAVSGWLSCADLRIYRAHSPGASCRELLVKATLYLAANGWLTLSGALAQLGEPAMQARGRGFEPRTLPGWGPTMLDGRAHEFTVRASSLDHSDGQASTPLRLLGFSSKRSCIPSLKT
jgi:hypothetical protein